MAKIVNTTPGDYQDPLAPGSPSIFSVKCNSTGRMVGLSSVEVRHGLSGVSHRRKDGLGVVPELAGYQADVRLSSPERRTPYTATPVCDVDGSGIRIPGGVGSTVAGVYEIEAATPVRGAVAASVTFDFDTSWTASSRYWFDTGQLLPLYVGLEYGPTNTGLFLGFSNAGAGVIVAGGPSQNFTGPRPGQRVSSDLGWLSLPNHAQMTVLLVIDEMNDVAKIFYAVGAQDPVLATSFSLAELGQFAPSSSGHPQWRDIASQYARFFFGHGGPSPVTISDYALFPYAPLAVNYGEAGTYHLVTRRPDLPVLYRVGEAGLPTSELLSRWSVLPGQSPKLSSFFLPGKTSAPYKATLAKSVDPGVMGVYRAEPHLQDSGSFLMDVQLDAIDVTPVGHNTGVGVNVAMSSAEVRLRLLQIGPSRKLGVLMLGGDSVNSTGYYVSDTEVDWSALSMLRVVYTNRMNGDAVLSVYAKESKVLSVTNPSLPPPSVPGRVALGHLDSGAYAGVMGLASVTYANELYSWEKGEASPPSGTGTAIVNSNGFLEVTKPFGSATPTYYSLPQKSLYQRGMILEFRARIPEYTDSKGVTDAPNLWTGAGATIFFGSAGTPDGTIRKLHLGFFDCGLQGRKVAILPGAGDVTDVLRQSARGLAHSASVDWTDFHTYRLLYLPNDRVEVWVDDFSNEPVIQLLWSQFFAERDPFASSSPSLAFGFFNPNVSGRSEWEFLRSGFSTGFEFVVRQEASLGGKREVRDLANGRELLLIQADDVVP